MSTSAETAGARILGYLERRARPLAILLLGGALFFAGLRIVEFAFIPPDDSLRHAATGVSGRPYTEVIVFDAEIPPVDSTPGWHRVLRTVHRVVGLDQYGLIGFSVLSLFVAFTASGLFLVRRPEAWAAVLLLAIVVDPGHPVRLSLGRPFMLTSLATVVFVLAWDAIVSRERERERGALLACLAAAAVTTWLHSTWFLLLAVPGAALLTREWRATARLSAAVGAGVLVGAILTLQPVAHLSYPIIHTWKTMGAVPAEFRVSELRPFTGSSTWVLIFLGLAVARAALPDLSGFRLRHPAFLTAAACWILAFTASRFWIDIGLPALMAGLALALHRVLEARLPAGSAERWIVVGGVAASLYLGISANHGRRWESSPLQRVVWLQENPEEAEDWLPDPGGILYSADMGAFFTLFFTYPEGDWRYILGPEQALMPREDLEILHGIADRSNWDAFLPWVEKLRPEDRLFVTVPSGADRPEWEGVEIFDIPRSFSIVRTVRPGSAAPAGDDGNGAPPASTPDPGASAPDAPAPTPDSPAPTRESPAPMRESPALADILP